MTKMQLSVIICTHNPRPPYLRRVLAALREQTFPKEKWEFFLVDNASRQPVSIEWDISWHPNARHVSEPELGLSTARLRGIREASSDLLIFVDDDNVLDADYLSAAVRIGREWPKLGTWGSAVTVPEFEVQPSKYVTNIVPYLALRQVDQARWSNFPSIEATPWGAGLCLRRAVAEAYCKLSLESRMVISGRKGSVLLSGDDVELSYVACRLGLGLGIFPELKLTHLIPRERVEKSYLLRIVEGTSVSNALLAYKWKGDRPRSPLTVIGLLSILKNLLLLRGIDREIYLAKLRATVKARRMTGANEGVDQAIR